MSSARRIRLSISLLALVFLQTYCNNLEHAAKQGLFGPWHREPYGDQGVVYFDDTGNITVVLNNTQFYMDPFMNATSFVGVWLYNPGADPYSRCCTGSGCPTIQANSCLVGFGFSNDLGFAGSFYIDLHPPEAFNPFADKYYMPVYAAGKDALPSSYQGEYTTISSPTGLVADRTQYDLYVGVFYSVWAPGVIPNRVVNQTKTINGQDLYTGVDADFLSPTMRVEARFYPQSDVDPAGSQYIIPPMINWNPHRPIARFADFRNLVILNEIVGNPVGTDGNTGSPELVEIYNKSTSSVDLYGWRLSISGGVSSTDIGITAGTSCLQNNPLPAGGYLVLAFYNDAAQAAGDPAADCDFSDGVARVKITSGAGISTSTGSARLFSDASSTIVDFVQYSSGVCNSQSGLSSAVSASIWNTGDCVNTSGASDVIRRVPNAQETNVSSDWAPVNLPSGGQPTPGAPNI